MKESMEVIDQSSNIANPEEKLRIIKSIQGRINDFEESNKCRFSYKLIINPKSSDLKDSIQLKDGFYWNISSMQSCDILVLGGLKPKFELFRFDKSGINNILCIIKPILDFQTTSHRMRQFSDSIKTEDYSILNELFYQQSVNSLISILDANKNDALVCLVGDTDSEAEIFVDLFAEKIRKPVLTIRVNDVLKENGLINKTIYSEKNRVIYLSGFDFIFSDLSSSPKIPNRELSMLRHDLVECVKFTEAGTTGNIILLNVSSPLLLPREIFLHVKHVENVEEIPQNTIKEIVLKLLPECDNIDVIVSLLSAIPNKVKSNVIKQTIDASRYDSTVNIYEYIKSKIELYESTQSEFKKVEGADFKITTPLVNLDRVVLSKDNMEKLQMALASIVNQDLVYNIWGFSEIDPNIRTIINFYGPPGTGKTLCANAIAHELSKKTGSEYQLLSLNYSEIESMYVGEAPKKLERVFNYAKDKKIVLFFDEADSFLGKRIQNVSQGSEQAINSLRSTMLIQLEKYTGVVIFATNLTTNYDSAFKTRFLAEIEFPLPDKETCKKIFLKNIPSKLYNYIIDGIFSNDALESIANSLVGLSGRDIKTTIWRALLKAAQREGLNHRFTKDDFLNEIAIYKEEKKTVDPKLDLSKVTTEVTPASQELAKRLGLGNDDNENQS